MSQGKQQWAAALALTVGLGAVGLRPGAGAPVGERRPAAPKIAHVLKNRAIGRSQVAFAPDGKTLASASARGIRLWHVATGKETAVLEDRGLGWVNAVAFAPDGKTLASAGDDRTARLWDRATGRVLRRLESNEIVADAVSFSPDGKLLAVAGRNAGGRPGAIHLWDTATGKEVRSFGGPNDWVIALPFAPDGKTLATGGVGRVVRQWEVSSGKEVRAFPLPQPPQPDGRAGRSGRPTRLSGAFALAFSPDGKTLATGCNDGALLLWDVPSGKVLRDLSKAPIGPNDFTSGPFGILAVTFAPDGKTLASAGGDARVTLWDLEKLAARDTLAGHGRAVWSVAFSPDGTKLASAGEEGTVRIWDLPDWSAR